MHLVCWTHQACCFLSSCLSFIRLLLQCAVSIRRHFSPNYCSVCLSWTMAQMNTIKDICIDTAYDVQTLKGSQKNKKQVKPPFSSFLLNRATSNVASVISYLLCTKQIWSSLTDLLNCCLGTSFVYPAKLNEYIRIFY